MTATMKGACNCGDIRYEVAGEPKNVVNCHCGLCRRMNGAAFSTYVVVLEKELRLVQGHPASCQVTSNATKSFCSRCGTPIYNQNPKYEGLCMLYLGSLDEATELAPQINIYCESEVDWVGEVKQRKNLGQGIA